MAEEKRSIGYLCPVCGNSVVAERTAFQLMAGRAAVPCPCGGSELRLEQLGDRCEITVPCLFCARDHRTVCANDTLLRRRLVTLSCGKSGLGICHIGEEGAVFQAMGRLEEAADRLRSDAEGQRRGTFLNDVVMEEVLSELKDIAGRGGVRCGCGSTEYGVKVGFSDVELVCARCGAALRLPAAAPGDIDDLCARYALTIPGKKEN